MKRYTGHFDFFSEMGMEGSASVFFDEKAKYLTGYGQLDLSYFFKNGDQIKNVIIDKYAINELNFVYDLDAEIVKPIEISTKEWKGWIKEKYLVSFDVEKELFKDKIILKANNLEKKFLKKEVKKLLSTADENLSEEFIKYKNEILELKKLLKLLNKNSIDGTKVNINQYIFEKSDYYFNRSPLEIILTGDGHTVIKNLKAKLGLE